jgi:hypothetical protein
MSRLGGIVRLWSWCSFCAPSEVRCGCICRSIVCLFVIVLLQSEHVNVCDLLELLMLEGVCC